MPPARSSQSSNSAVGVIRIPSATHADWAGSNERTTVRHMSSAAKLATSLSPLINAAGATFMLHPESNDIGMARGFTHPFQFYTAGRGGVMGNVDADVVVSAFGFFAPGLVRKFWETGTEVMAPREAATLFAETCHVYGRKHLAGVDGLERLSELGEKVIDAADGTGLALFAGWAAEPLPDDAPARALHVINVLREHRGSAHIVAVIASGLSPLQVKVSKMGEGAKQFGWKDWQEDLLDLDATQAKLARVEELTDELVTPSFAALSTSEAEELSALITAAHTALVPAQK
jgi:hypothetical protein